MTKTIWVWVLAASGTCLFAQSTKPADAGQPTITQATKPLHPDGTVTPDKKGPAGPPILNVLTVIGENILGLPCLECILGIGGLTLGLPVPLGEVLAGTGYQIDSFLIDNKYNGPCTFTVAVKEGSTTLASVTTTQNEVAGTQILLTTPVTIPTSAGVGLGTVSTTSVCGSATSESKSDVAIACVTNPPFCLN